MTDNTDRLADRLSLAFQLEGLPVGTIEIRHHHLGLLEVHINGKGPFILSPTVLATSSPEAGYVSEDLRAWIDEVYLNRYGRDMR